MHLVHDSDDIDRLYCTPNDLHENPMKVPRTKNASWVGATVAELNDMYAYGDRAGVESARDYAHQLHGIVDLSTEGLQIENTLAGGIVVVPRYLAGVPTTFRRGVPRQSNRSPVRLWLDVSADHRVPADKLRERGIACLALAQLLAKTRPVEMMAFSCCEPQSSERSSLVIMNLGLTPVNWSLVSTIVSGPCFRDFWIRCAYHSKGITGGHLPYLKQYDRKTWRIRREVLGAGPDDIVTSMAVPEAMQDVSVWFAAECKRLGLTLKAGATPKLKAPKAKSKSKVKAQPASDAPTCSDCGKSMVKRTARRGKNAGGQFWGCSGYPRCRGTRDF